MILRFEFEYLSTSLVLEKILLRASKEFDIKAKLTKEGDRVCLYVEDSEERVEEFANYLAQNVPHSIFVTDTSVEVAKEMPKDEYKLPNYPKREFPFCPKCYKNALKEYDIFTKCEVCGYDVQKSDLVYKNFAKEMRVGAKEIIKNIANVLKNGATIKIKTFNGYKKIALLSEKNYKLFGEDFELIFADAFKANEILGLKRGEILSIGSFEKPLLKVPTSKELLRRYSFMPKEFVKVGLSDELLLEFILNELKKLNEPVLMISKVKEDEKFHISLDFSSSIKPQKRVEVLVLGDGKVLLVDGDRGIIPKTNPNFSSLALKVSSKEYVAINTDKYIITYKKDKKLPEVKNSFILGDKQMGYEPSWAAFYSIIAEHDLFERTLCGVYMSQENSDKVMVYHKRFGVVEYIRFGFEFPDSIKELFEMIGSEDEVSKKLVKNYLTKFPDTIEKEFIFEKMGDMYKLWGVIAIVLGFFEGKSVKDGAKDLVKSSNSFMGKKGPRIDYKLTRKDQKPTLDTLKVIKTAMSFRLAGIDKATLSFGVVESFAEFLSNLVDEINQDYEIDGVCMNGSSFSSAKFADKFYTITSKNYQVYTNKEFGLDDINLCYGMISGLTKEV